MEQHGDDGVRFELFSSSFCGACTRTRAVLEAAVPYVPGATLVEHDVAFEPELAERRAIEQTPTVIVRDADDAEVLRATGVPNVNQVLAAAVRALGTRGGR